MGQQKNRVRDTTTTTGTGALTLLQSAPSGYRTFWSAYTATSTQVCYLLDDGAGNWEIGRGTFTRSTNVLTRTTILDDSAGTFTPINLAAGTKTVSVVADALACVAAEPAGGSTWQPPSATGAGSIAIGSGAVAATTSNAIAIGIASQAVANNAVAIGGARGETPGALTFASTTSGVGASGQHQSGAVILHRTTTNATPAVLWGPEDAVVTMPTGTTWLMTVRVAARNTSNSDSWAKRLEALVRRDSGGTLTTIGTPTELVIGASASMTACNATLSSTTVNVTGLAATTIDWTAELHFVQVK